MPGGLRLPRADQASSPLLRLPAELRIKILRNLHRKESVIHPERYFLDCKSRMVEARLNGQNDEEQKLDALETYEEHVSLSSQTMRTCQQLRDESGDILYMTNTLLISMAQQMRCCQCDNISLQVLNTDLELPSAEQIRQHTDTQICDYVTDTKNQLLPHLHKYNMNQYTQLEEFLQTYQAVSRFQSIQLQISWDEWEEGAACVRMLRTLFHQKDVLIVLADRSKSEFHLYHQCFRCLRCKSFDHRQDQESRNTKSVIEDSGSDDLSRDMSIISSQKPVQDTYMLWCTLHNKLVKGLEPWDGEYFFEDKDHYKLLQTVQRASVSYSFDHWKQAEALLLGAAVEWIKKETRQIVEEEDTANRRVEREIQEAQQKTEELREEVGTSKQSIAETKASSRQAIEHIQQYASGV